MLTAPLIYPVAIAVALAVGGRAYARRLPFGLIAARVLLVLYLGWMAGAVFLPIPLSAPATGLSLDPSLVNHPNLVPLTTLRETLALEGWPRLRLLGGNVLVFAPFGILAPIVWPSLNGLGCMTLAGLLLSLAIELGQLAVSLALGSWVRMSDVDDVLLNVPGVLLGFALYRGFAAVRARSDGTHA
jgi:glycopeptide antibiotics resistance protein